MCFSWETFVLINPENTSIEAVKKGYFYNFKSNAIWQLLHYAAFLTVASALSTLLICATTVVVLSLANRRIWNIDSRTFLLCPLQKAEYSTGQAYRRTALRVRRRNMYQPSALWHTGSHRVHTCCHWLPRVSATGCEAGHRCRPCSETPHCSLPPQSGWQGALLAGLVGGVTFLKNRKEEKS